MQLSLSSFKQLADGHAESGFGLMKWVHLMERISLNTMILSMALAHWTFPLHCQYSHSPITGFECTASEEVQRVEKGGKKTETSKDDKEGGKSEELSMKG